MPTGWLFLGALLLFVVFVVFVIGTLHPLHIVWDLDDTVIKSDHICNVTDQTLKCTILSQHSYHFEHIDDDLMHFKTRIRPHARPVLFLLSLVSRQYIFTAASRGYMENVARVVDPRGNIFTKKLSSSDFPKGTLRNGKDIRLLVDNPKRTILIDDNILYHRSQPTNGVHARAFNTDDRELLRICFILLRCLFVADVRDVLRRYHTEEYLQGCKLS